jgi:hypothetical protein
LAADFSPVPARLLNADRAALAKGFARPALNYYTTWRGTTLLRVPRGLSQWLTGTRIALRSDFHWHVQTRFLRFLVGMSRPEFYVSSMVLNLPIRVGALAFAFMLSAGGPALAQGSTAIGPNGTTHFFGDGRGGGMAIGPGGTTHFFGNGRGGGTAIGPSGTAHFFGDGRGGGTAIGPSGTTHFFGDGRGGGTAIGPGGTTHFFGDGRGGGTAIGPGGTTHFFGN